MKSRTLSIAPRAIMAVALLHAASLLAGCAVVETIPELHIEPIGTPHVDKSQRSAILGFQSGVDEGWTKNIIGIVILDVDGARVAQWHGAVVPAGRHRIVAQYRSIAFRSDPIPVDVDLRPSHKYLILCEPFNEVLERRVRLRIIDLDTGEVIYGRSLTAVAAVPQTEHQTALFARFREAMSSALTR